MGEKRVVAGIDDIHAVRFECANERCAAVVVLKPATNCRHQAPSACPICGHDWEVGKDQSGRTTVNRLWHALCDVAASQERDPVRIRIELDAPDA